MAYDKVVDSAVLDAGLKAVADAIREKGGTTDGLAFPAGMAQAIAAIEAGGVSFGEMTPYFCETIPAETKLYAISDVPFNEDKNYIVLAFQDLRTVASPPSASTARATVGFRYVSLNKTVSLDIFESTSGSFLRGNLQSSGVDDLLDKVRVNTTYSYEVGIPYHMLVLEF